MWNSARTFTKQSAVTDVHDSVGLLCVTDSVARKKWVQEGLKQAELREVNVELGT
jgi:hypothetical protein